MDIVRQRQTEKPKETQINKRKIDRQTERKKERKRFKVQGSQKDSSVWRRIFVKKGVSDFFDVADPTTLYKLNHGTLTATLMFTAQL